jgi:ADP-ribosyl-[dinitrogen reductase] hydrolase
MWAPDRARGALLGLAVGDAVGTTNEFSHHPPPISGMVGGGPFRLRPGQWTDDTSMALCLADSLIACGGFDARDQIQRYVRWWRDGENSVTGRCFDIGNATRAALERFERSGDPYAGDPDPFSAGNGSIMRLAPVLLVRWPDEETAISMAAESSLTTHAAPEAVEGCRALARCLLRALAGASREEILAGWNPQPVRPTGYVVDSLNAALCCFAGARSFGEGCLAAANLGGDADTIAAIYGQVAGAHFGESGIPAEWLELLSWAGAIRDRADQLRLLTPARKS